MASKSQIPRYLVIQDTHVTPDSILRVSSDTASQTPEEAGLTIGQPDVSASTLVGDIKPALSGSPERATAGELRVGAAGVEGNGRWSFGLDGDDDDLDFRFRQRPSVVGKRIDCLSHATSGDFPQRPRLRELTDGRLLLLYMEQDLQYYDQFVENGGWTTAWRYSILDPTTDTWSNPALTADLGGWDFNGTVISGGPYWTAFDMVVYPDTGEVVAVVVGGYSGNGVYGAVGAVYGSTDNGATWTMRGQIFDSGVTAQLAGDGVQAMTVACEITETGRLVILMATPIKVYGLTSNDRGRTFTTTEIITGLDGLYESSDEEPVEGAWRQAMSMRRLRNGTLMAYHAISALETAGSNLTENYFYMTIDGSSWSRVLHNTDDFYSFMGVAVVERPDGYPWIYATCHDNFGLIVPPPGIGNVVQLDELVQIAITARDPVPTDTIQSLCPTGANEFYSNVHCIHPLTDVGREFNSRPNAPAGLYSTLAGSPTVDGFATLGAVNYRGQVILVVCTLDDNTVEYGTTVYRLDYMQPIQERLEPILGIEFPPAGGHRYIAGYHRTWDCYALPQNWGMGLVGAGGAIVAAGAQGGYLSSAAVAAQNYWSDLTLPFPEQTYTGLVRCVMRANSGGSLTANELAIRLILSGDGGTNYAGLTLRMEVIGTSVWFVLVDELTNTALSSGTEIEDCLGQWVEILMTMWQFTGQSTVNAGCWVRKYDRSNDPDWMGGYTELTGGQLTITTSPSESLSFGHIAASSTANAHWKALHTWRPGEYSEETGGSPIDIRYAPVAQQPSTYVDEQTVNVRADEGVLGVNNDAGTFNFMRPAQMISYPEQFMLNGLAVSWRGEALAAGAIPFSTRYTYPGRRMLDQSTPQAEWRSVNDDSNIEIVLDAELSMGSGATWDLTAIAFISKNFHTFRLEFNATDDWSAASVSVRAGIPGVNTPPKLDRTTHIFDLEDGVAGNTLTVTPWRCTVSTPSATARDDQVFRPHRFATKEPGERYYAVFVDSPSEGQHTVLRIKDNTENTLIFYSDPSAAGIYEPGRIAIYSDRFAWDLRDFFKANYGTTQYQYCRILIEPADHFDNDEQFQRAGLMILGRATKIGPGIEYGYSVSRSGGNTLTSAPSTGANFRRRNHSGIRSWILDGPTLEPANEPGTTENADVNQAIQSWQRTVDVLRRVENDGDICVLALDPFRLEDDTDVGDMLLTDPYDCAAVRVSSSGSATQAVYTTRSIPRGTSGSDCVPKPVAGVRSITLTEEI